MSGIFDLTQGDPTKQEEGQLGDLSTFTSNTGQGAINAGNTFEQGILSGDPATIARTLAPEISTGAQEVQQQAKTNAEFGNRGGGTNASTQAAQSNERGNIINLIGQEQQGAAQAELGLGTNLLSQATNNITADAGLKTQNQQRKTADVGGIAEGVGQIATGFFDPAAAAGGVTPQMASFEAGQTVAQPLPAAQSLDAFNPDYSADQYPEGV